MERKKRIMESLAKELNERCLTIGEFSKEMGYTRHTYLAKKVKRLKLGYRIKTIHLLSQRDQEVLRNSIQRRTYQEQFNRVITLPEEDRTIQQMEKLLIQDLNENYCLINEISKREGYNDDSAFLSRKAKQLGLGIRIKTITLLSKEDQETLINSIKRRKKEDL